VPPGGNWLVTEKSLLHGGVLWQAMNPGHHPARGNVHEGYPHAFQLKQGFAVVEQSMRHGMICQTWVPSLRIRLVRLQNSSHGSQVPPGQSASPPHAAPLFVPPLQ